jgi:sulfur carrier protein
VSAVTVRVNGEPRTVAGSTTVRALLLDLGALRDGVAVAVNDAIVLRSTWEATELHDHDSIEVLSAAPGG